MYLEEVYYFLQVAKAGSFTQASHKLNLPKSTLSRKVRFLEDHLGTMLIQRTTRQFFLTETGLFFYQNAMRIISELEELNQQVQKNNNSLEGLIRITAPPEFGSTKLPMIINSFNQKYPTLQIELVLSNKYINLIEENIDIAIRASGKLADSSLIAKKILDDYFVLVAAEKYIKNNKPIKNPQDLEDHKIIQFTHQGQDYWSLHEGESHYKFKFKKHFGANSVSTCLELVKCGLGISFLPFQVIKDDLKKGLVKQILPKWTSRKGHLYIVYQSQKFLPIRVKLFIDHLKVEFGNS